MNDDDRSLTDSGTYPHVERRSFRSSDQSAAETLGEIPALVILERLPIPVLAIGPEGTILFANAAFTAMLGHTQDTILELNFQSIFYNLPADQPIATLRAYADELVELTHRDGSIVRARMSKSAMLRTDDTIALATFHDLTETLWHETH